MSTNQFAKWSAKAARFKAEADSAAIAGLGASQTASQMNAASARLRAKLDAVEAELNSVHPKVENEAVASLRAERDVLRDQLSAATAESETQREFAAGLSARHAIARRLAEGASVVVERLRPHYGPGASRA